MLLITGCQKLVARRDESQVAEFAIRCQKENIHLKYIDSIIQKPPSNRDDFYEKIHYSYVKNGSS